MGMPNMDFVVRENRAVVRGQMAIVRLGTCGAVQRPAKLGDLLIASHGSIGIRRDSDYWTLAFQKEQEQAQLQHHAAGHGGLTAANGNGNGFGNSNGGGLSYSYGSGAAAGARPYMVSLPVPADGELAALLTAEATAVVGPGRVVQGLNASADSFYSSQVRRVYVYVYVWVWVWLWVGVGVGLGVCVCVCVCCVCVWGGKGVGLGVLGGLGGVGAGAGAGVGEWG